MLTKDASNALLKTLEEPPEHAYFILATTELHKILDTIISRCQTFIFGRFTIEQLVERLQKICDAEKFTAEKIALELIARKAEGGLRDAISALDQIASESGGKITEEIVRKSLGISSSEMLENFWQAIADQDAEQGFEVLRTVSKNGADLRTFGHDFLGFLREKMFQNLKSREILATLIPTIEEIEKALLRLKTSPITELPLEIAVVKLCSNLSFTPNKTKTPSLKNPSNTKSSTETKNTQTDKISRDSASAKTQIDSPSDKKEREEVVSVASTKQETTTTDDFTFDDETEIPAKKINNIPPLAEEAERDSSTKTTLTNDLTAQKIKDQMENIAKKSDIPVFVKKSFLTTSPQVKNNTVTFCTSSSFHYDQISSPKIRGILQATLSEIFGQKLIVECSRGPASSVKKEEPIASSDDLDF
jgi:DNA polymerase-3 subunit gamma/tau